MSDVRCIDAPVEETIRASHTAPCLYFDGEFIPFQEYSKQAAEHEAELLTNQPNVLRKGLVDVRYWPLNVLRDVKIGKGHASYTFSNLCRDAGWRRHSASAGRGSTI